MFSSNPVIVDLKTAKLLDTLYDFRSTCRGQMDHLAVIDFCISLLLTHMTDDCIDEEIKDDILTHVENIVGKIIE